MSTNDMAQDSKTVPTDKEELTKIELADNSGGYEIAALDDVDVRYDSEYTKIELTQGQQMQISGLMNQLPALLNVAALPKTVRLTFPNGVQGSLMALKRGGCTTTLVDKAGKIVGTASLHVPTFQAAALSAFTVMSIVSGQYFLTQINSKLSQISCKLDEILAFLYGDKWAELLSEDKFTHSAYTNYKSVMEHSEQRLATLISLQSAKKVAMKDIEFYLSELKSIMDAIEAIKADEDRNKKKRAAEIAEKIETVKKMMRTQEFLQLSLQLYTTSSLLEVYYSENFDTSYINSVETEASQYIVTCGNLLRTYLGGLKMFLAGAKDLVPIETVNKVNAILEEKNEETTPQLLNNLKSALKETREKKQYYLTQDGGGCKVYMLNAS